MDLCCFVGAFMDFFVVGAGVGAVAIASSSVGCKRDVYHKQNKSDAYIILKIWHAHTMPLTPMSEAQNKPVTDK